MGVPVTKPDPGVDKDSTGQERNTAAGIGVALDLGVRLGASVFLGLGAGLLLDSWLHTSPLFTLIGMGDLTLVYNKTRQATITREMIEIASGAEALGG